MSKGKKRYDTTYAKVVRWTARQPKIDCSEAYVRDVMRDRNIVTPLAELIRKTFNWKWEKQIEVDEAEPFFLK